LCEDTHPHVKALAKPPHPHPLPRRRRRHGGDRTARSRSTLPTTDGCSRRGRRRTTRCRAGPGFVVLRSTHHSEPLARRSREKEGVAGLSGPRQQQLRNLQLRPRRCKLHLHMLRRCSL
jgi:hypothetical protein